MKGGGGGSQEGDSRSRVHCQGKPLTPPLGAGWRARVSLSLRFSLMNLFFSKLRTIGGREATLLHSELQERVTDPKPR